MNTELRSLIFDYVVIGKTSILELDESGQKEILFEYLKQLPKYRSHEFLIDSDKDEELPRLFKEWLCGKTQGMFFLFKLLELAIDFYSPEIDEIFEEQRETWLEEIYKKTG